MNARRRATLSAVAEAFVPADARVERIVPLAIEAIESLSPQRSAELLLFLDLLTAPMLLPLRVRATILRGLADSPIAKLRSGFAALKRLVLFLAYAEGEPGDENPTWPRIGYPGPRHDRGAATQAPLTLSLARDGETVAADVVVIGSGAGGGVAAAVFARAGKRVVVLEAGTAWNAQTFTQRERSIADLYLDRGLASSDDVGLVVLAGETLGGGTTINWSTSFRLAERVAAEWERESGIAGLAQELVAHYDALERELQLEPCERHNANNAVLVDGCRALGLHVTAMPRNAPPDCGEGCGYCGMGCAYGKKRSTPAVFLPDVLANGGSIYANARAERILLSGARARGVEVRQTVAPGDERQFVVEADVVVCAGGSLRTPGILARSGIAHPLLGKRLFVHPVFGIAATFERPIEAWHGPIQSAYSDAFDALAGNYGVKLEVAPVHPAFGAMVFPWQSAGQHARAVEEMRFQALLIALTRDRDPGSIDLDAEAAIHYALSPFDAENLLAGLAGAIEVAFAAGAQRVSTLHNVPLVFERAEWNDETKRGLVARLRHAGLAANRQPLFSAHQMGTAPFGADPESSVVDPLGRIWGYENLLVADASLFPQASGVNPMLTIMALARRIASLHAPATAPALAEA